MPPGAPGYKDDTEVSQILAPLSDRKPFLLVGKCSTFYPKYKQLLYLISRLHIDTEDFCAFLKDWLLSKALTVKFYTQKQLFESEFQINETKNYVRNTKAH